MLENKYRLYFKDSLFRVYSVPFFFNRIHDVLDVDLFKVDEIYQDLQRNKVSTLKIYGTKEEAEKYRKLLLEEGYEEDSILIEKINPNNINWKVVLQHQDGLESIEKELNDVLINTFKYDKNSSYKIIKRLKSKEKVQIDCLPKEYAEAKIEKLVEIGYWEGNIDLVKED